MGGRREERGGRGNRMNQGVLFHGESFTICYSIVATFRSAGDVSRSRNPGSRAAPAPCQAPSASRLRIAPSNLSLSNFTSDHDTPASRERHNRRPTVSASATSSAQNSSFFKEESSNDSFTETRCRATVDDDKKAAERTTRVVQKPPPMRDRSGGGMMKLTVGIVFPQISGCPPCSTWSLDNV